MSRQIKEVLKSFKQGWNQVYNPQNLPVRVTPRGNHVLIKKITGSQIVEVYDPVKKEEKRFFIGALKAVV